MKLSFTEKEIKMGEIFRNSFLFELSLRYRSVNDKEEVSFVNISFSGENNEIKIWTSSHVYGF